MLALNVNAPLTSVSAAGVIISSVYVKLELEQKGNYCKVKAESWKSTSPIVPGYEKAKVVG